MNWQGYFIVLGSLATVLGAVICGVIFTGPWAKLSLTIGIVGFCSWIVFALWVANQMNTDI